MSLFPIPLFPEASLASSVVTSVWIGVLIFGFFHLRFGWVFSGLVVPGYLVPIIILKPLSAVVILIEAIITYGLIVGLKEVCVRTKVACELFGRDRFFAIVLASIAVRILGDATFWPWLGDLLFQKHGVHFDYRHQLSSFGLIVICLIANQFWKTGLIRGLPPFLVVIACTFVVVRYVLMEYTNYSMSNLAYLYEDVATSIEASPKAYIVLITTAFAASRMNVLYGWDFSGIMIPALIALQWFEPIKILASFLEALAILGLGMMALKLPLFRSLTMEGARKVMLFFTISYLYKVVMSYAVMAFAPELKVSDTYGFGYLLPTLIATKMHQSGHIIRQIRMTLQISLVSTAVASLIGFSLTHLPDMSGSGEGEFNASARPHAQKWHSLKQAMQLEEIRSMRMLLRDTRTMPKVHEREAFRQGVLAAIRYADSSDKADLNEAKKALRPAGYDLEEVGGRYLTFTEGRRYRGWGVFVIDRLAKHRLAIECPQPLDEEGTWEAASALFESLSAHALAFGTRPLRGSIEDKKSVLRNRLTLFHSFHRLMSESGAVQVRGYTDRNDNMLSFHSGEGPLRSTCWIKDRPPESLDFKVLGPLASTLTFPHSLCPIANVQRESHRSRFVEFFFTARHLDAIASGSNVEKPTLVNLRPQAHLLNRMTADPPIISPKGSETYVTPSTSELLFLDRHFVTPLVSLARRWYELDPTARDGRLARLNQRARVFHYHLTLIERGKEAHVVALPIQEALSSRARHWGILALRLGNAEEILLEVPRPGSGLRVVNFGLTWLQPLRARALLIAGSHPNTNADRSADVLLLQNKRSVFSLVHEVLLRESGETPTLALQLRALAEITQDDTLGENEEPPLAYLACHGNVDSDLLVKALQQFESAGIPIARVEGEAATAGYDVGSQIHARYLAASANNSLGVLWLGPNLRARYEPQDQEELQLDPIAGLGIQTEAVPLSEWLLNTPPSITSKSALESLSASMVHTINQYFTSGDVNVIQRLLGSYPSTEFVRVLDVESGQAFLTARTNGGWDVVAGFYPGLKRGKGNSGEPILDGVVTRLVTHQHGVLVAGEEEENLP